MSQKPPRRLEMEDLVPALRDKLAPRVARLGYLGEFFRCMGHQPAALLGFIEYTEVSKKSLPANLVEIVALTVAARMGNAYERNQHERLSIRLGLSREWVEAAEALSPETQNALSDVEKRVQRLALTMLESDGKQAGAMYEELAAELGDAASVALLMVVTRYVAHAIIVNTLALAPPVPSIFEDGFNG